MIKFRIDKCRSHIITLLTGAMPALKVTLFTMSVLLTLQSAGFPVTQPGGEGFSITRGFVHLYLPLSLMAVFIVLTILSLRKQVIRKNSALKLSEEKYRLIFENSPIGILHFDRSGVITACNSSFEKIIGSNRERLIGLDISTLPDIRVTGSLRQVLNGETCEFEGTYNSSINNRSIQLRAIFSPLTSQGGVTTGGLGIIEDVTLRRHYEDSLVQARESAERASRIKNIFLANMSHEVRTPLNGILGLLQIMKNTSADPAHQQYIDMAVRSGERLTRLLSDILDLSKIETEHFTLIKENVDIRELLTSIKDSLSDDASRKRVDLSVHVSGNVPPVISGDELRIRQVVQNLAENSLKFTDRGSITISADFEFHDRSKGELTLTVSDTGIGIEQDKLREILEPFRQAENSFTRKFQGAGLGLAIVRRLITLMSGTINIDSAPGKGTEVKCTMILETCEDCISSVESAAEESEVKPLRILLVEDDRINSLMLKRLLEKMEHTVTEAANGIEAIQRFEEGEFDIVLMDIQMPEMNGIEAVREIRRTDRFGSRSSVNVIALTAYAMAGDRERFLEAGFSEYLPKPIDMEELKRTIIRLLHNR